MRNVRKFSSNTQILKYRHFPDTVLKNSSEVGSQKIKILRARSVTFVQKSTTVLVNPVDWSILDSRTRFQIPLKRQRNKKRVRSRFLITLDFTKFTGLFSYRTDTNPVNCENPVNPWVDLGNPVKRKVIERALTF